MGMWIIAGALFLVWLIVVLAGRGGFIHILLLCALTVAIVQFVADRRAARG